MSDDSVAEDYLCFRSEEDLFVTFYRIGVVDEKYLKCIDGRSYDHAFRYSQLWIESAIKRAASRKREADTTN